VKIHHIDPATATVAEAVVVERLPEPAGFLQFCALPLYEDGVAPLSVETRAFLASGLKYRGAAARKRYMLAFGEILNSIYKPLHPEIGEELLASITMLLAQSAKEAGIGNRDAAVLATKVATRKAPHSHKPHTKLSTFLADQWGRDE
jgi:hypothetical protein